MSALPTSSTPLDYALPDERAARRDRVVFQITALALFLSSILPLISLSESFYYMPQQPGLFTRVDAADWCWWATGPIGLALVIGGFIRSQGRRSQRRWAAGVGLFGLYVIGLCLWSLVLDITRPPMSLADRIYSGLYRASDCSLALIWFAPWLLMGEPDAPRWHRRLVLLAASCCLLSGVQGLPQMKWMADEVAGDYRSPTVEDLWQVTQFPAPVLGLWPVAGFVAAALLLASRHRPRPATMLAAVALGVGVALIRFVLRLDIYGGHYGWGRLERNLRPLFVARTLWEVWPLAILGWAALADPDFRSQGPAADERG